MIIFLYVVLSAIILWSLYAIFMHIRGIRNDREVYKESTLNKVEMLQMIHAKTNKEFPKHKMPMYPDPKIERQRIDRGLFFCIITLIVSYLLIGLYV